VTCTAADGTKPNYSYKASACVADATCTADATTSIVDACVPADGTTANAATADTAGCPAPLVPSTDKAKCVQCAATEKFDYSTKACIATACPSPATQAKKICSYKEKTCFPPLVVGLSSSNAGCVACATVDANKPNFSYKDKACVADAGCTGDYAIIDACVLKDAAAVNTETADTAGCPAPLVPNSDKTKCVPCTSPNIFDYATKACIASCAATHNSKKICALKEKAITTSASAPKLTLGILVWTSVLSVMALF